MITQPQLVSQHTYVLPRSVRDSAGPFRVSRGGRLKGNTRARLARLEVRTPFEIRRPAQRRST
jgi:hypothetical protein